MSPCFPVPGILFSKSEQPCIGEHLFVGYGSKAIMCWSCSRGRWNVLNSDGPPLEERIGAYQTEFENEGK